LRGNAFEKFPKHGKDPREDIKGNTGPRVQKGQCSSIRGVFTITKKNEAKKGQNTEDIII